MNNEASRAILSKNLRMLMQRFGKERTDICNDLGFKYTTFTDWYNGNKYPRIDKIEMLAKYFGVLKSDLIEDKNGVFSIDIDSNKEITKEKYQPTKTEQKLKLLARHLDEIPDDKREKLIKNFEDSIDVYLDALGIPKEDK